ncbi:class II aaRS and biotin synthetase [Mycena floridula]|nr:class II aaRS and biotin synthetase [Mycena floridula]
MNILVYAGGEVPLTTLNPLLVALKTSLSANYSVQTISHPALRSQPWASNCAALVLPRCTSRFPLGADDAINSYLNLGGSILALASAAQFSQRTPVLADRSLRLVHNNTSLYLDLLAGDTELSLLSIKTAEGSVVQAVYQQSDFSLLGMEQINLPLSILARSEQTSSVIGFKTEFGNGRLVVWGVNPEISLTAAHISNLSQSQLHEAEKSRLELWKTTLLKLGLPPTEDLPTNSHPLPQFLISASHHPVSSAALDALVQTGVFEDTNDSFRFHRLEEAQMVMKQSRLQSSGSTKDIIDCLTTQKPDPALIPLWDMDKYFDALHAARLSQSCSIDPQTSGIGEALLYGEIVTSTQTMLDKNPRLMASLPSPFVSLASHQLNGRGRGNNVWISPAGCLQFSILLHLPLSSFPSSKLVFIQYLFALAVVEACREDTILGPKGVQVRLKWPNDLYAVTGPNHGDKKKIGGILVNTSFSGGKVAIIIGCGVNVLNPPPIFSLSQLDPSLELSMERTAATIFAKFEKMWTKFVQEKGSFDSFMDLYLERWLHSDELVTITTTTPPIAVRICGITPDHGLLRTLPESTGWSTATGFIDLQPDGNSFDLMAGLIKSK